MTDPLPRPDGPSEVHSELVSGTILKAANGSAAKYPAAPIGPCADHGLAMLPKAFGTSVR